MEGKRYYWLKLKDDFFDSKRIKKLRKLAGGDTYTIIYLKMQLLAMKQDGIIHFTGLENTFAEELALDLNENPDDVGMTMNYLVSVGLAETSDDSVDFFLPYSVENTGSETAGAERVRAFRKKKMLHCNTDETQVKQVGNGEIEKEKDIEIEKEKRVRRFTPPTLADVQAYCIERGNNVDAQRFIDYYTANGWKVGRNPMKDWKASVRTWERTETTKSSNNELQDFYNNINEWAKK